MPASSAIYAAARVSAIENKILNSERLNRMVDCGKPAEALKVLYEVGYADGLTIQSFYEYDILLNKEYDETVKFFSSVSPNEKITDCFLIANDYHNAKVLVKAKIQKTEIQAGLLLNFGKIEADYLKNAITTDSYSFLPKFMGEALLKIDNFVLNGAVTPSQIDMILDKAYQLDLSQRLKKVVSKQVKNYFSVQTDLKNISVLIRLKKLSIKENEVPSYIMPGGKIAEDKLVSLYDLSLENFCEHFRYTEYKDFVLSLIDQNANNAVRISDYEKMIDNYLIRLFKGSRYDHFSINPLIGYFVAKLIELKNVRIIMTGLINNVEKALILERLREAYV